MLPLTDIDAVWSRGHASWEGAIAGGLVSGLAVGGFTALVASAFCASNCGLKSMGVGLLGFAAGGAAGGLVGALIGSAIPAWDRRYAR